MTQEGPNTKQLDFDRDWANPTPKQLDPTKEISMTELTQAKEGSNSIEVVLTRLGTVRFKPKLTKLKHNSKRAQPKMV